MEKVAKRLDRPSYWKWTVPLVAGHVFLSLLVVGGVAKSLGSVDTLIIVFLARTLAWRFRDIGWPGWIGPTILIATMLVLPLLVVAIAAVNNAGDDVMQCFSITGLVSVPVNLVLLIVAGSVPGKPGAGPAVVHVFD